MSKVGYVFGVVSGVVYIALVCKFSDTNSGGGPYQSLGFLSGVLIASSYRFLSYIDPKNN